MKRILGVGVLAILPLAAWQQPPKKHESAATPTSVSTIEQPDAQHTKEELSRLLGNYPSTLRAVLALDPSLFSNQTFLAPYPALMGLVNAHPEVARNPAFYVGDPDNRYTQDHATQVVEMWKSVLGALAGFTAFGMGIGLIVWLIRTLIDYRRWNRLTKVQTEVHTKLLDRFAAHDDVLAYIQSPAGSKFLQSSPIRLDAGPKSVDAPMGRILWSVQGGLVLVAGGIGLFFMSASVGAEASQPLHALGILGVAVGLGFVISAIISFLISQRLGLIELPAAGGRSMTSARASGIPE